VREVALEACAADDARLTPLLDEYLREWSALVVVPVVDGRFVYEGLGTVDRVLFIVDGDVIGFAFTTRDEDARMHVEEMFIVPRVRRSGAGTRAVRALFATGTGAVWTFTVRSENPNGLAFWRRACPGAVETWEPGGDGVVRTRFTVTP
jgi:predicted acetyltransferase